MAASNSRRDFFRTAAVGSVAGLGALGSVPGLSAEEVRVTGDHVRMQPEIEPLVHLIETTQRDKLLEKVAAKIKDGVSYKHILAALLLAGVKNVQPRPSVGFKFHAVLVVNSAHLASLASPDEHRWLPIFWALDEFKASQQRDISEGDWTMSPVNESAVPPAHKSAAAFTTAMENWDVDAADAAVAGLARGVGSNRVFELFCQYAVRDFRSIGHKAIFLANAWRTLQVIGWRHSEPVLRSLAYAMLNHNGEPNPAENDLAADRPWRRNKTLLKKLAPDWRQGEQSDHATKTTLAALRNANYEGAVDEVIKLLETTSPQSIWDGLFLGGGELLARQPGIVSLHALTSTNAIHYLYQTTRSEEMKRMLLLQNTSFVTLFREAAKGRGKLSDTSIEDFVAESPSEGLRPTEERKEILKLISTEPEIAADSLLAYLKNGGEPEQFLNYARLMVFFKGSNSHDYKFSSAVLEDYYSVSPAWRDRFLAASVFKLRGSGGRDNPIVERVESAFA